jgi:hypothetical protein
MGRAPLRLLLIPFLLLPCLAQPNPSRSKPSAAHSRLVSQYGKLPMAFEANQGQSDPRGFCRALPESADLSC